MSYEDGLYWTRIKSSVSHSLVEMADLQTSLSTPSSSFSSDTRVLEPEVVADGEKQPILLVRLVMPSSPLPLPAIASLTSFLPLFPFFNLLTCRMEGAYDSQQAHDILELSSSPLHAHIDQPMEFQIRTLARKMSYPSTSSNSEFTEEEALNGINPFDGSSLEDEPRLDPLSPSFDWKFWLRNARASRKADPERFHHASLGVAFKQLRATGIAPGADYQATTANAPFKIVGDLWKRITVDRSREFDILKPMDGLLKKGSTTIVLGRPGAGCTTLLKTLASHTYGYHVHEDSIISYDGLTPKQIKENFRGDVTYSAEMDVHYSHLTVGQTLNFAASLRTPQNRPSGISRKDFASYMTQCYMAMYGLSHTFDTKVGCVSGGERKRVSIAEISLSGSYLQCWDNATRGLDSAIALEFIRALKMQAELLDVTSVVAIYQCSQSAYDLFDNCILLYEGYQIYNGPASLAKDYFERMGYRCPEGQTTADFLTSLTNPTERLIRKGFTKKVPRTPKQFYDYWNASPQRAALVEEIDQYLAHHQADSALPAISAAHRSRQSDYTFKRSPYTVSFPMQVKALTKQYFMRTLGSPNALIVALVYNLIIPIVKAVLFFNQPNDTSSFYSRGAALLIGLVANCVASLLEMLAMFEGRPVIEKHRQFALYRPSAAALAAVISELPTKIALCIIFNTIYYFMINFRREPGPFFFFLLVNLFGMMYLSLLFRAIASAFDSPAASTTPSATLLVAWIIYSGFPIPIPNMLSWGRWINYLNPIGYSFEALLANELQGRNWPCANIVPSGPSYTTPTAAPTVLAPSVPGVADSTTVCTVVGAVAGQSFVTGDAFLAGTYDYSWSHAWRNFGIVVAFTVFFLILYLLAVELNKGAMQTGEKIIFPYSKLKKLRKQKKRDELVASDVEARGSIASENATANSQLILKEDAATIHTVSDVFHWRDVCYDIPVGKTPLRLLNNVDGWIKPGTLTALMGASGAGKTTLLDVLASRATMGIIYGHMFVNGHFRDASFQRSTGYAQQQDVHLETTTVREALRFSANLRQPASVSQSDKYDYVEAVISILEMDAYADAVVGVAGEGLNVEQRKRLTIGVELAAKPKLLLFLDEPTSGLDSQTAWSIIKLMQKLASHGQAILCTIHQPSAILFEQFDRLLFLTRGGRTVYFGDIGKGANKLVKYFESNGAPECPPGANPAEWMLSVVGAAPGTTANQDYHEVWRKSKQFKRVQRELLRMERDLATAPRNDNKEEHTEYAASKWSQYYWVTKRMIEYDWRNPVYLWSKLISTVLTCLFLGFSTFQADLSLRGLSNQLFCVMLFTNVSTSMLQQTVPHFLHHRGLFEARERPSKIFSWFPWIMAQITAEFPWQLITGTLAFFTWFYPVGFYQHMEGNHAISERTALTWIISVTLHVFISTFSQLWFVAFDDPMIGAQLAVVGYTLGFDYSGIMRYPHGFWKFIYRAVPFSYYASALGATTIGDSNVTCSATELVSFSSPLNATCGEYMDPFITSNGGYLVDPSSNATCRFCPLSKTNDFLVDNHIEYDERWQNWGIFFCYIFINMALIVFLYWIARVPKSDTKVHGTHAPPSNGAHGTTDEVSVALPAEIPDHGDEEAEMEMEEVKRPKRSKKAARKAHLD